MNKFRTSCALTVAFALALTASVAHADNPILPGLGVCDPQVRVFDGRVYLYATHDYSPNSKGFRMDDWWEWATDDLVNWKQVSTLKPEQTFIGKPFHDCWATDAATRGGKYYWYFSAGRNEVGVVEAPTPTGPWTDPLGKPLVAQGLTPTQQRDPGILMDDDSKNYMVYGTYSFYLVRLGDDMISLAEKPRLLTLDKLAGPYGEGKTDDKPFLHKYNGKYYLSWGCYYATADNPYGPYTYKGSIVVPEKTQPELRDSKLTYDRHGSFFEFKGQWYFICNDLSRPGASQFFRDSVISYVHYRANGDIAPLRLDKIGVGTYDARGPIEAEDYFDMTGAANHETTNGGFEVRELTGGSALFYPRINNIADGSVLKVRYSNGSERTGTLEVRQNNPKGKMLGSIALPSTGGWDKYNDLEIPLAQTSKQMSLCFNFVGPQGEWARLDSWQLQSDKTAAPAPR